MMEEIAVDLMSIQSGVQNVNALNEEGKFRIQRRLKNERNKKT